MGLRSSALDGQVVNLGRGPTVESRRDTLAGNLIWQANNRALEGLRRRRSRSGNSSSSMKLEYALVYCSPGPNSVESDATRSSLLTSVTTICWASVAQDMHTVFLHSEDRLDFDFIHSRISALP